MKRAGVHSRYRTGWSARALGIALGLLLLSGGIAWAQLRDLLRAFKPMPIEQEVAMGRAIAAKLIDIYGLYENPEITEYVNLVGQTLAERCKRKELRFHFAILDHEMINAFSAPGGYVFITTGVLQAIQNEEELAGVLGHEIGHIAGRHVEKEARKSGLIKFKSNQSTSSKRFQKGLDMVVSKLVQKILTKGFSRQDEFDADKRGTIYAAKCGYAADGLHNFLSNLDEIKGEAPRRRIKALFGTHPGLEERIAKVEALIQKKGYSTETNPTRTERFLQTIFESE